MSHYLGNVSIQNNPRVPCDVMGAVLLLIFKNEFAFIVLCLSFSFRYLVEVKLFQSLTNETTST